MKLHPLFCDGMVLQQGKECPIWGTADPGEQVQYEFNTEEILGGGRGQDADKDGNWKLSLKTGKAGGPYNLTIKGKNTVTIKDVYVGEVWVASGQSNMEMSVNSSAGADEAKKNAGNPKLRLFTVEQHRRRHAADDRAGHRRRK